jgi:hypothetical protein
MAEELVRMASYHLDEAAQLWFIQLQDDEGTPTWGRKEGLEPVGIILHGPRTAALRELEHRSGTKGRTITV